MAAGDLLIEAKAMLRHGEWLPWLRDHCAISARTAQLYMRLAKQRQAVTANAQSVADLTLIEAAALLMLSSDVGKLLAFLKSAQGLRGDALLIEFCIANDVGVINDASYDPAHGKTSEQMLEWEMFKLWLVVGSGYYPDGAAGHVEWLLQRDYITVAEWMADDLWCSRQGMSPIPQSAKDAWSDFLQSQGGKSLPDVVAEIDALATRLGPPKPAKLILRRRSKVAA